MCGESPFGNFIHPPGTNLNLHPFAIGSHHSGMEGLVSIGLGSRYPVADPLRFGCIDICDNGIDVPALRLFGNILLGLKNDPDGKKVINFFERDIFLVHLLPDGID